MTNWDLRYLSLCDHIATWSKDPSTKVGSVIIAPNGHTVISTGYNGFARGILDTEYRLADRETKYGFIVHAELNAILNAARNGYPTMGCTLYCSGLPPCRECAKAIIQAGIAEVVVRVPNTEGIPERWIQSIEDGDRMLKEAVVTVHMEVL